MKNLFIYTNVIIDVLADRKPFSESAARLFNYSEKGKHTADFATNRCYTLQHNTLAKY